MRGGTRSRLVSLLLTDTRRWSISGNSATDLRGAAMDRRDLQLSLVQDLLAAPGCPEGWHAFLLHLCDALGGSAANFISHDLASSQVAVSVTARTDPQALVDYGKHWHQVDPWAHSPLSAQLRTGSVVAGDRLIGRDDMRSNTVVCFFFFLLVQRIAHEQAQRIRVWPERQLQLAGHQDRQGRVHQRYLCARVV